MICCNNKITPKSHLHLILVVLVYSGVASNICLCSGNAFDIMKSPLDTICFIFRKNETQKEMGQMKATLASTAEENKLLQDKVGAVL